MPGLSCWGRIPLCWKGISIKTGHDTGNGHVHWSREQILENDKGNAIMQVTELKYSSTNTYLIAGSDGLLLFDTGWAGTFPDFCRAMGEKGIPVQEISYILISHFHPDHCGIAQEIADCGPIIAVMDVQKEFVHAADSILQCEPGKRFLSD